MNLVFKMFVISDQVPKLLLFQGFLDMNATFEPLSYLGLIGVRCILLIRAPNSVEGQNVMLKQIIILG